MWPTPWAQILRQLDREDAIDLPLAVVDYNGRTTYFTYDALNRLSCELDLVDQVPHEGCRVLNTAQKRECGLGASLASRGASVGCE